MVENRPVLRFVTHLILIAGAVVTLLPIWITFVASTHPPSELQTSPIPMWPGDRFFENYAAVLGSGIADAGGVPVWLMIASATATFLFRQFFMTVPDELAEAARIDGAIPMRFFRDILLPLSRTNIAALFVILFIYGWNQYLWPLLITTDEDFYTIVMGIQRMVNAAEQLPVWHYVMATAMLAMIPPVAVVIFMQRQFVKGLVETEK
jgi:sn-glycerol 3-phosphate transport system permease protein